MEKLVEIVPSEQLFLDPAHHYTKGLLASIPVADPTRKREYVAMQGEIPSPTNPPSGCRFHTRVQRRQPVAADNNRS
ncbi:hypothetical protein BVG16_07220 [Paenibacillus selenitireducens]|uniref:Oligopeptide/dipeptide ABC transporter C-terminal domain-containing protein n=1 Tax=Paenibacillus selenitireducens TaxID=1324314 RepID=A0A1T2XKW3_9BACL|nr:oligopeptide/dipeptide ABC transporter ATP-binding protein [Paenibacillus selenitireducens]OPA80509.1 hypothetical protein BVG16_07220 [Paenibacillus selenitireducens]